MAANAFPPTSPPTTGASTSKLVRRQLTYPDRPEVSLFNTWEEIKNLYITERSEGNKYLKNILASNEKVRAMLTDVMCKKSHPDIMKVLKEKISTAPLPPVSKTDEKYLAMAINRLRNDVKMYDWASEREKEQGASFRVYFNEGHILFAIPRKWYDRIALDTGRAKIAHSLCKKT